MELNMNIDYAKAIEYKYPLAEWSVGDTYESLVWHGDIPQPSKDQLRKDYLDYKAYTKSKEYVKLRADAYPPIGEQLDAIIKHLNYMQMSGQSDLIKELDAVVGKCMAVKKKYPKPTETKKK